MERGPWRAPDPGAGGPRPGLSGPPSPRGGRAATRRAGAGSPGGRGHGPAASHGHGRAAGQYEPGFDSGQARSGSHPRGGVVQSSARCPARLDSHVQSRGDGSLLAGRTLCRATALGGGPLSWLWTQRDDEVSRRRDGFGDLTTPRLSAPPDTPLTDATASPRGLPVHRAGRRPRGLGTAARPAAPLGQWPQWPLMASPPFPRACQGRPRLQPRRPAGRLRLPLGASAWAAPP